MINKIKNKLLNDLHFADLLKGSAIAFLLKLFGMIIGYISMLYISNLYGANVFGILTLSITILSIFSVVPNFGMSNAVVRIVGELYSDKRYNDIKYSLKIIFIFTTILSLLFILLLNIGSDFIASNILNKIYMTEHLKVISIAILSNTILVIVSSVFQSMKQTKQFIIFQTVLLQFVFLVLLILNYYSIYSEDSIVQIYTIATILSALTALAYLFFKIKRLNNFIDNTSRKYNFTQILQISRLSKP
jgi:O-antigen/teichoic acid export membrane protein